MNTPLFKNLFFTLTFAISLLTAAFAQAANYTIESTEPVVQQVLSVDVTKDCQWEYDTTFRGYQCEVPLDVFSKGQVVAIEPSSMDIADGITLYFGQNLFKEVIEIRYDKTDTELRIPNNDESLAAANDILGKTLNSVTVIYQGPKL